MAEHEIDSFHCPFTAFVLPGFNLRPLDLTARIGMSQLLRLDETVRRRVEIHRRYQQRLEGVVDFARVDEADLISSISFGGVAASNAQRKVIVSAPRVKNEIDTRLFSAGNLGRHPFWTKRHGVFSAPVADRIHDGGFFLPNNQSLDAGDIDFVSDVVIKAVRG